MTDINKASRRSVIKLSSAAIISAGLTMTATPAMAGPATDLPPGLRRGRTVAIDSSMKILEVQDPNGKVTGYTFSSADLIKAKRAVEDVNAEFESISNEQTSHSENEVSALGWVETAKCAGEILLFVGGTVFPTVRVAALAARLVRLVNKYGATKVARILAGARNISTRRAEREILELGAALVGLGFLQTCREAMGR